MSVTLNLPPEIEGAFQGEAQARGLSLDEFLSGLITPAQDAEVDNLVRSIFAGATGIGTGCQQIRHAKLGPHSAR